ncbi:MAG: thiamine pyrophosphate-dependent dehydrogenase E1 component subunit alpha [Chloroflexota bacterium]|nr:thiamine pyrophosphate-dependent dehydrogenase E1 component subunit alpha [Chloroflexota bacterium]
MDKNTHLYQQMLTIRSFESLLLEKFSTGIFTGTTHTSLGQEANAVGVLSHIHENDVVVSNHRCHGHFLAYGGDPRALFAELMGKPEGVCGGVGGSQHLHWRNFYSSGVQGGTVPMAAGMALAEKKKGDQAVVIDFMGDGTLGEGIVYESLNMIALWDLPILIVLENNHIAQTTPADIAIAGSITQRFEAFGIPVTHIDSSDVLEISPLAGDLIHCVRGESMPQALVIDTARLGTHSKGDDTRPQETVENLWQERDPITIHGARLPEIILNNIRTDIERRIKVAFNEALQGGA